MKTFKDRIVVITGAGSGMGRAYAMEFGRLGARLALNELDESALAETMSLLKAEGHEKAFAAAFDVSDKEKMNGFAEEVAEKLGNAHVLINNAGIEGSVQSVFHTHEASFRRVMEVNFFGVLNGCKAFLPQLIENNEGAVVNVSSIFGLIGPPNHADYCSSKFAVRGFTEALAVEFRDSPISIHCVHPGGIDTNIVRKAEGKRFSDKFLSTPPEKIVKYVIKCIGQRQPKIVYGKKSWYTWFGSNFVPQRILNTAIWLEMKSVIDTSRYAEFIKNRKSKIENL